MKESHFLIPLLFLSFLFEGAHDSDLTLLIYFCPKRLSWSGTSGPFSTDGVYSDSQT